MAARHELSQLAAQFAALWETIDTPPDVFAFLRDVPDPTHQDKLAVLLVDQSHRWRTEQPLSVEEYLEAFPDLASDQDAKIELAVGEFKAQRDSGRSPDVDVFVARLADLDDSLRSCLSSAAPTGHKPAEVGSDPPEKADDQSTATTSTSGPADTRAKKKVGRYRLVCVLGEGTFGKVWLAHDAELARYVAIKAPTPERLAEPEHAEEYLAEARILASLDHPSLVPVYDVAMTDGGSCYVVYKFIEGSNLAARIKEDRPSFSESAELIAAVAGALHHAHERRIVHRDVNPKNILIESTGIPYLADFGLALREEDYGKGGGVAGTAAYMSPEQASGEGHRLDGRSDIFSLGVVFYELLTGKRPFRGSSKLEILQHVIRLEPQPPRELDENVPAELERICLKALAKRASDRYATAEEVARDLMDWKSSPAEKAKEYKIVPRGLRAFDSDDADFFLELLPGPRDHLGLPESVRYWKSRIEEVDPDKTFTVGLIYGPSGCGKSSLVKAGLLPRLATHVITVYVEATPEETETRILRGLRRHVPDLPDDLSLVDAFSALRRRLVPSGKKVLVVLDQFEQWLHAKRNEKNTELVAALRQCDGGRVQCVVLVRDDFWMAITRFMRDLDIRLLEGINSTAVDLFDEEHALKVLAAFGRAYGRLPASPEDDQDSFLQEAVAGLAQDGKVVSVRLALFAEMVKGRAWKPTTLAEIGGAEGVGVTFLDETFSARTAPPQHRLHQQAAREVLKALLPEHGTDIKGSMRLQTELREASGYRNRPRDFDDLLRILDGDVRLITPTDPEGATTDSGRDPSSKCYQLTHDYLVPSLREWLTRKQKETRRGRAELRLAERAAFWNSKAENRYLPSWWEWANIRWLTDNEKWSVPQRKMMSRAGWYHGVRATMLVAALVVMTFIGLYIRGGVVENSNRQKAEGLVSAVLTADIEQVPLIIQQIDAYRPWADPMLKEACAFEEESSTEHLQASLALLPADPSQVDYLKGRLLAATPDEVPIIRDALLGYKDRLIDDFWQVLEQPSRIQQPQTLQAASALAAYDPGSERWEGAAGTVTDALVSVNPMLIARWAGSLQPVRASLLPYLAAVYRNRDGKHGETEQTLATNILEDYAAGQPETLADLVMDAEPKQFAVLYPKVAEHKDRAVALLRGEIDRELKPTWKDADLDPSWATPDASLVRRVSWEAKETLAKRQANAAVALVRLGQAEEIWPLLKHSPDPRVRSWIIHRLGPMGADLEVVANRIADEPDVSSRRALILSLGEYDDVPPADRESLTEALLDLYRDDPDPGIHGATEWLLRRWNQEERLNEIDEQLATGKVEGQRRWYINGQGHTMVVISGPVEFLAGSPSTEADRHPVEQLHRRRIGHSFAIATKEVTVEQFQEFLRENATVSHTYTKKYAPEPDCPQTEVIWYEAAAYCNWLSKQEGIAEDQWCYLPKGERFSEGMKLPPDYLSRTGYRLPTESEWEYSCRALVSTSRYYGQSDDLLRKYAWYLHTANDRSWPVASLKPNDWGMFDLHGNVWEWCQERYLDYSSADGDEPVEDVEDARVLEDRLSRVLRGGSFYDQPWSVRSAYRDRNRPTYRRPFIGFRPARTCP